MKRHFGIMSLLLVLAFLTGCKIISVTPDPAQKIIMRPGESHDFTMAWQGGPIRRCGWYMTPETTLEVSSHTNGTLVEMSCTFRPAPDDVGAHTLQSTAHDLIESPIPPICIQCPPGPNYITLWSDSRTWNIEVWGVMIVESAQLVTQGTTQTYSAKVCPTGAYAYEWILDGQTVATEATFTFAPTLGQVGKHTLVVKATGGGQVFSYAREIVVPLARVGGVPDGVRVFDMQSTGDGGAILAGDINYGSGSPDAFIAKLDSSGGIAWQKRFGGDLWDAAFHVQQTVDGGYILAGYTTSLIPGVSKPGEGKDIYIVKMDDLGIVEWQRMYGGSDDDWCSTILQTSDAGFLVSARVDWESFSLFKIDVLGTIEWRQDIDQEIQDILNTADGGYLARNGFKLLKLDSLGQIQWQKDYGDAYVRRHSLRQTADGGYIMAGGSNAVNIPGTSNHGSYDFYVVKVDAQGDLVWRQMYGGAGYECGNDIRETADGGYVVAGLNGNSPSRMRLMKIAADGTLEWDREYSPPSWVSEIFVLPISGDGYLLISNIEPYAYVFKVDAQGNM